MYNEVLNIKKLKGFQNLYSVRLTIHARIVIEIMISEKTLTPVDIATRAEIY